MTAPGASMIRPANSPDFPVRGPPKATFTSSHVAQTVNQPTRASLYANSLIGTRSPAQSDKSS
jgi:hypothetical protein